MANPLSRRVRTALFYALRTAFRLTPMPQATRDRLRQRFLDTRGDWVPEGPRGKAPDGTLPRRPYVRSDERAIGYVPYEKGELPDPLPATLVAFYLPQFHTIPENDEWWGKGFTEWRNVTRALPQFEGHYQPKLPGDLGFYDLRNVEVMREQARLAREYGISAFCFYFYWFGGKTLLETPLRNWLNEKTIDLKFCLCWANEKWTRTWDGRGDQILIDQKHSPEDDIAFIEHVAEYMRDPRYLRVDGKPILVVYRPGVLSDSKQTIQRWRNWFREQGLGELHLIYVRSFDRQIPGSLGFDCAVQFPPNAFSANVQTDRHVLWNPKFSGQVLGWDSVVKAYVEEAKLNIECWPCVAPAWDNEARRSGNGRVFHGCSPQQYRDWLVAVAKRSGQLPPKEPHFIFVNAWNEWAEGAYLEPDQRLGYAYLDATRKAMVECAQLPRADKPCVVIHAWYADILEEILAELRTTGLPWRVYATTGNEQARDVRDLLENSGFEYSIHAGENRGRDVLPFLKLANRLRDDGVEVALKLHTKRSPHRQDGNAWRRRLIQGLLSHGCANSILKEFSNSPRLGLVAPEGDLLSISMQMGANLRLVEMVHRLTATPILDISRQKFAAGTMFWVRLDALRPLLDAQILDSDFEAEEGQLDGTFAHAIERSFCSVAEGAGFEIATTADICAPPPAKDAPLIH